MEAIKSMILARDVMTQIVFTVFPDTPLLDAARLFVEKHVSGLPVVDESKHLVGILSEKDLLRVLLETDLRGKNVSDFMTREVISFGPTDQLIWICRFLMEHNIRRVPIVENNTLIGIVSRKDIVSQILKRQ
jgi:CBS domain-containing protein